MRLWIPILFLLLAVALAQSKHPVSLGGDDSLTLLKNLTNNSTIDPAIWNKVNGSALNQTHQPLSAELGGDGGRELFKNLTNGSSLAMQGNLSSWGSEPRQPPRPPKYDPRSAQLIQVIRDNHIA